MNLNILSIDAWACIEPKTWDWNNCFKIGSINKEDFEKLNTTRKVLKYMRDEGYLTDKSIGKCTVEDDQYNLVVCYKSNGCPLIAIEYGPAYN